MLYFLPKKLFKFIFSITMLPFAPSFPSKTVFLASLQPKYQTGLLS